MARARTTTTSPASSPGSTPLREWAGGFVSSSESTVLCGDFNIVPAALDSWNEERFAGSIFHTDEERARMSSLYGLGLRDLYREREPSTQAFSWWDYRGGAFHRKQGLRIDLPPRHRGRGRAPAIGRDRPRLSQEEGGAHGLRPRARDRHPRRGLRTERTRVRKENGIRSRRVSGRPRPGRRRPRPTRSPRPPAPTGRRASPLLRPPRLESSADSSCSITTRICAGSTSEGSSPALRSARRTVPRDSSRSRDVADSSSVQIHSNAGALANCVSGRGPGPDPLYRLPRGRPLDAVPDGCREADP